MKKLNSEQIIESLCEGGEVAKRLSSYEPRQAQLDLLELIIRAFNEDAHVMAEAGTGVGKSFAYLLPAMRFAVENKEKVVISTATITLQQQLYEKDIPLVASAMGDAKIKAVIMKGRGNYLCMRRLDEALRDPPLIVGEDDSEFDELKRINEWAQITKTGVRSELSFQPAETVWGSVCSESDLCLGNHCPWRENCFVFALRKEANNAQIIVVNHHLLFADLAARYQGAGYENAVVLPPFNRLVIDEAHTIENAATSFFSAEFGRTGIFRQLGRLYHKRKRSKRGLLVRLCALLPAGGDPLDNMVSAMDKIRDSAEELDNCALNLCGEQGVFRLAPDMKETTLQGFLFPSFKSLRKNILALTSMIRDITEELDDEQAADPSVWEIKAIVRRLEDIAEICGDFCKYQKLENDVLWIEKQRPNGGNSWAVFTKTPLDLSPKLKDSIFSPNKTVVCVSATLAINNNFSFWASRCGICDLENRSVLSGCFPSPFPYSSAVLLAAPTDAPLPDEANWQGFIDNAAGRLAAIAGGSALVLFTSYQSLRSAWSAAKEELASLGIRCLKQGDDDRTRLLQDFLSDESACLFATDSFWEGVDAPGDTLRLVIICRLPFRTPDDPVFEARSEAIEKRGGNPFMDLSLPHAVMKFKQGFGRLMRRSADHGAVVVLDGRLLKKKYGQIFLQSLPETRTSFTSFENILQDMEKFFYS
ncbi:MAG: DEAD/DEAH box helicase [Treponema sp.]|jgi:ATP-dependent DNA helicase DinG|nr:DEAD/DEAH box helicase [Treponema sp.]